MESITGRAQDPASQTPLSPAPGFQAADTLKKVDVYFFMRKSPSRKTLVRVAIGTRRNRVIEVHIRASDWTPIATIRIELTPQIAETPSIAHGNPYRAPGAPAAFSTSFDGKRRCKEPFKSLSD